MGHKEHKAAGPLAVACRVITVSDSRTSETDTSGKLIQRLLKEKGHTLVDYHLVRDDPAPIRDLIQTAPSGTHAVILSGGTGLSKRDGTFEVVEGLLEKKIEGFGELFRSLSYQEIGASAMFSRASAGIYKGKVIFSLPGSEGAVRLAMEKLILPELGHFVQQLSL